MHEAKFKQLEEHGRYNKAGMHTTLYNLLAQKNNSELYRFAKRINYNINITTYPYPDHC